MSWFNTDGNLSENILFSKFTYTRNLSDIDFSGRADSKKITEIINRADSLLKKNGFHASSLQKKSNSQIISYYEKQYVDSDFCYTSGEKAIFFNEPCSLSISIGGTNLINIYALLPGAAIRDAYKISSSAEELLDSEFDFAYDSALGYLSPLPHLCGSGVRISCALYLPLLTRASKISSLCASLSRFGASLYPIFTHKNSGDIYIMTYTPPIGRGEEFAVELFEKLMLDTVSLEKEEQNSLDDDSVFNITENASRAIGIFEYANSLSEEEMITLQSDIRLGLCIKPSSLQKNMRFSTLNSILSETLASSLLSSSRKTISCVGELDRERAEHIRKIMKSIPEKSPATV